jgi:hypothetical protein
VETNRVRVTEGSKLNFTYFTLRIFFMDKLKVLSKPFWYRAANRAESKVNSLIFDLKNGPICRESANLPKH